MAARREAALSGHRGDPDAAREALAHPDPGTRTVALGALARIGALTPADVSTALADLEWGVRRRAAELAVPFPEVDLVAVLADREPFVAEAACWALGERADEAGPAAVAALSETAGGHKDPLVREAAVAALGAIGDDAGLPAILAACKDKPAVRRRAVLALAPFDGPEVEAALAIASGDRDWQVRQASEDLGG